MNAEVQSNRKAELLSSTVEHVAIDQYDARPIIDAMRQMSFTSRDTARAADIFSMALEDPSCSTWLTLAGSTSAGGCMHIYRDMVKYGLIDAVVATGASIVDMDFFEALGFKHYQAKEPVDDRDLRALYIDRIYDTYIDEEELQTCDAVIKEITDQLEPRPYSSREFIWEMGKWLAAGAAKKPGSLIQTAYEEGVPIFCPAFTDSSAGFGLVKHQVERMKAGKPYLTIDSIADWRLRQLHLPEVYGVKENPLPWLQSMLSGVEHANFFEARSTEYSKAATKGQWHGDAGVWSEFDRLLSKRSENTLPAE